MKIFLYDLVKEYRVVSDLDPGKASGSIEVVYDPTDLDYLSFAETIRFSSLQTCKVLVPIDWVINLSGTELIVGYGQYRNKHKRLYGGDISFYGWLVLRAALGCNGIIVSDNKLINDLCLEGGIERISGYRFGALMSEFRIEKEYVRVRKK